MCQIVVSPIGKTVPRVALKFCFKKNPDGAGFAYVEKGKIIVVKGFMGDFEEFWKAYQPHEKKQMLIHFRIATHGKKCPENCHPFFITDGLVMAHNGMLSEFAPYAGDDRSDTRIFAEDYCRKIMNSLVPAGRLIFTKTLAFAIDPFIRGNKIVFMTADEFTIINQKNGDWSDGVWYSNGVPTKLAYGYGVSTGTYVDEVDEDGKTSRRYIKDEEMWSYYDDQRIVHPQTTNLSHEFLPWDGDEASAAWMGYGRGMVWDPELKMNVYPHQLKHPANATTTNTNSISNTTTATIEKADHKIANVMNDYDKWLANEITEPEWYFSLGVLTTSEFSDFVKFECADEDAKNGYDKELIHMLAEERRKALAFIKDFYKTTTTKKKEPKTTALHYPPWLDEMYKSTPISPEFRVAFKNTDRGFLLAGCIVSRKEISHKLKHGCEVPKGPGLWEPLINGVGVVYKWKLLSAPKEAEILQLPPPRDPKPDKIA